MPQAPAKTLELTIYDAIGPNWFGEGITAKSIKNRLDAAGAIDQINVRINSPGGTIFDGWSIYNQLKNHSAKVSVFVDGLAASAASVIAMAGDEITMAANSHMMIHNPLSGLIGTAADMRKEAQLLDQIKDTAVQMYADRTGQKSADIAKWMDDETWLNAAQAKEKGFATAISPNKAKPTNISQSLVMQFKNVPDEARSLFVAPGAVMQNVTPNPATNMAETKETIDVELNVTEVDQPQLSQADVTAAASKAASDAVTAERKRTSDVRAIAALAKGKLPAAKVGELEDRWVNQGIAVEDARREAFDAICAYNPPVGETNADNTPAGSEDPNAEFKREYAKQKAHLQKLGTTEEEYVAMRRIDEGLDSLAPVTQEI